MTVIVCIDDRGGMTFNKRRVSRDAEVSKDISESLRGGRLLAAPMSKILFDGYCDAVYTDDLLREARVDDFCFIEDKSLSEYADKISAVIIYKWNRKYPSDKKLDLDPVALGFRLCGIYEFKGNSHDKITKEVYRR